MYQNKISNEFNKILSKIFFNRATLKIARELLGKFLVRQYKGKTIALMINEVEAYDGPNDKASHASRGMTKRNKIMFDTRGYWYLYFIYGKHWMLNITIGAKNYPAAILIRGAGGFSGPGKLTKHLKLDKKFNGLSADKKSDLWIEDRGIKIKPSQIIKLKRIGVDYAEEWKDKLYRFKIDL